MLTPRQKTTLDFISGYIDKHGYAPTYREIMAVAEFKSTSQVNRILCRLEDRQFIRRLPGQHRAVEVIRRGMNDARS